MENFFVAIGCGAEYEMRKNATQSILSCGVDSDTISPVNCYRYFLFCALCQFTYILHMGRVATSSANSWFRHVERFDERTTNRFCAPLRRVVRKIAPLFIIMKQMKNDSPASRRNAILAHASIRRTKAWAVIVKCASKLSPSMRCRRYCRMAKIELVHEPCVSLVCPPH